MAGIGSQYDSLIYAVDRWVVFGWLEVDAW